MAKRISVDKVLFAVTLLLVLIGVVMVFSASAVMAKDRFGSPYAFFLRQMAWAIAGFLAMVVIAKIDYRHYKHPAIVFGLLSITTLLLIAVFFFDRSHNTHRWIHLGLLSLQPSELAKFAVVLFLATVVKVIRAVIGGAAGGVTWTQAIGFAVAIFGMGFICSLVVWAASSAS